MIAPQSTDAANAAANDGLSLSSPGRAALIRHEGVIRHYYNDTVHNCTYGVGTLAHLGPCTSKELKTRLTDDQIATSLQQGISTAERSVRKVVTRQHLTQQQFDALVSFVYNVGAGGAHHVLRLVNSGQLPSAAQEMMRYTHAVVREPDGKPKRDKKGHIITRVLSGLVTRRTEESAPFRAAQQGLHK